MNWTRRLGRAGHRTVATAVACVVMCAQVQVKAQTPISDQLERQRISAQRAQANASFAQAERECQQRFAVTACVDEARTRQREALVSLRRQSALIDEAERRQRAAARVQAIRGKVSAEEARQRDASRVPARASAAPAMSERSEAAARPIRPRSPAASAHGGTSVQREADEARSRARFEARREQTQAHREAAERRAAQRQQRAPAAAPLPEASAPRR